MSPKMLLLGAVVGLFLTRKKGDAVDQAVDESKVKPSIPERLFASLDDAKRNFEGAELVDAYRRIVAEFRDYLSGKGLAPSQADDWFKDWGAMNAGAHPEVEKPETEEERDAANKKLAEDILADMNGDAKPDESPLGPLPSNDLLVSVILSAPLKHSIEDAGLLIQRHVQSAFNNTEGAPKISATAEAEVEPMASVAFLLTFHDVAYKSTVAGPLRPAVVAAVSERVKSVMPELEKLSAVRPEQEEA